jgi:hypothetical protein
VVRVLLVEEAQGRDAATLAARRRRAGFPANKTFDTWRETASTIPTATQQALRGLEWIRRGENLAVVAPPAPASRICSKRSATPPSMTGSPSRGSPSKPSISSSPTRRTGSCRRVARTATGRGVGASCSTASSSMPRTAQHVMSGPSRAALTRPVPSVRRARYGRVERTSRRGELRSVTELPT